MTSVPRNANGIASDSTNMNEYADPCSRYVARCYESSLDDNPINFFCLHRTQSVIASKHKSGVAGHVPLDSPQHVADLELTQVCST